MSQEARDIIGTNADQRYMEHWNQYASVLNYCVGPTAQRINADVSSGEDRCLCNPDLNHRKRFSKSDKLALTAEGEQKCWRDGLNQNSWYLGGRHEYGEYFGS